LTIVAAVARNGVIGGNDGLLWRLKSDLRHFRAITMGKPLVMGRKTYESIGRALPGRSTIVLSRRGDFAAAGVLVASDVLMAIEMARSVARAAGVREVIIAGGGEVYAQTLGLADRLCLTEVDLAPLGEATFPPIDAAVWREMRRDKPARSEGDEAEFCFVEYRRIGAEGVAKGLPADVEIGSRTAKG
jgi:dihydrofolate reductase